MDFAIARRRLVETCLRPAGIQDERLLRIIGTLPRHRFVQEAFALQAYADNSLPIGFNQTISKPSVVAKMLEGLALERENKVLEIGTGCGYQAAVLSQLVKHVYSVEIVPELAESASRTLRELHYDNITVRAGDGYAGWPEHAPFDGIIVTAAAPTIPPPLLQQLKPGGRLVIPVGQHLGNQELLLVEVDSKGKVSRESKLPVRFVPVYGGSNNNLIGWQPNQMSSRKQIRGFFLTNTTPNTVSAVVARCCPCHPG